MASNIHLSLWFSYITIFHLVFTFADHSDNYIIHMDLSAMPKPFTNQHTWYLSTLSSALENLQPQVTTNNLNSLSSSKLIYTYTHVMNGFSASLSPTELEALKTSPGYISSIRDLLVKHDTTHSPQFLGLNPKQGAWPASKFGRNVIVGLVDTGVWPESKSYNDKGMPKVPSKWKGQCENSIYFNSSLCNKKLIGAKFFNKGYLSKHPNTTLSVNSNSVRDTEGHGTHTSTTAAGNQVDNASYFGYAEGELTGIASKSCVAMYKPMWEEGGHQSDIIAAIDSAISDGVDVLSLSFGIDDVPLYQDPVAIATFAAMEKGIFVSTSAGNAGPSLKTLHNGIPWVITAAAGTLDREFHGSLTLANGIEIQGWSLYLGNNFPSRHVPIVFMDMCDNVKKLVKVKSSIVVCEEKNGNTSHQYDQTLNLENAKVVGGVFISNNSRNFLHTSFPSIFIDTIKGNILKAYIESSNSKKSSKGIMSFKETVFGSKPAPSVASYSSRGPSNSCPFVLKPDITAPGSSILAAWPSNIPVTSIMNKRVFSNFNLLSGTSMSCPHIAGVGALLKGAHSDWSPAAIRSAIMTTSDIFDNTMNKIKDIGKGYKPATPFALGAGHVNPNKAVDPGLVYDVGVQDYVNLLCALNFTQKNITAITRTSSNNCSNPSLDLNYPSFIAYFSYNDSRTTQEFERVVTNVGERQAIYVGSVSPIEGFSVSVVPNKLVFSEKNEKVSYKLRIERTKKKVKKVGFGYVTWTDVKHVVRSPIVVTALKL